MDMNGWDAEVLNMEHRIKHPVIFKRSEQADNALLIISENDERWN